MLPGQASHCGDDAVMTRRNNLLLLTLSPVARLILRSDFDIVSFLPHHCNPSTTVPLLPHRKLSQSILQSISFLLVFSTSSSQSLHPPQLSNVLSASLTPFSDKMPWISDAPFTCSPSRYMATDFHRLTNRQASSPPSPDLTVAHEPKSLQANDQRPVITTPDKRASLQYSYITPCVRQGSDKKNDIKPSPAGCVKEDDSRKLHPPKN